MDNDITLDELHSAIDELQNVEGGTECGCLESTYDELAGYRRIIKATGVNQELIQQLHMNHPDAVSSDLPVQSYTKALSTTNLSESLEAIDLKSAALISAMVAAFVTILNKVISWLSGPSEASNTRFATSVSKAPELAETEATLKEEAKTEDVGEIPPPEEYVSDDKGEDHDKNELLYNLLFKGRMDVDRYINAIIKVETDLTDTTIELIRALIDAMMHPSDANAMTKLRTLYDRNFDDVVVRLREIADLADVENIEGTDVFNMRGITRLTSYLKDINAALTKMVTTPTDKFPTNRDAYRDALVSVGKLESTLSASNSAGAAAKVKELEAVSKTLSRIKPDGDVEDTKLIAQSRLAAKSLAILIPTIAHLRMTIGECLTKFINVMAKDQKRVKSAIPDAKSAKEPVKIMLSRLKRKQKLH